MINETFWLSVSLIAVVSLSYKPVKTFIENFLITRINQTQNSLKEAEKTYKNTELYLKKIEKNFNTQLQNNKQVLEQTKNQLLALTLKSEKETKLEIERQLKIAEIKRKTDEKILKREIMSEVLTKNVEKIVFELKKDNNKDIDYINSSLDKLNNFNKGV